jgi:hypothetical protein
MLYMKTRVTFRLSADLADTLRELPNQTRFVETALRAALGKACPVCAGTGRFLEQALRVSDFRDASLPLLERQSATQLKQLVRLGRELAATRLDLEPEDDKGVAFVLARNDDVLMRGQLRGPATCLQPN